MGQIAGPVTCGRMETTFFQGRCGFCARRIHLFTIVHLDPFQVSQAPTPGTRGRVRFFAASRARGPECPQVSREISLGFASSIRLWGGGDRARDACDLFFVVGDSPMFACSLQVLTTVLAMAQMGAPEDGKVSHDWCWENSAKKGTSPRACPDREARQEIAQELSKPRKPVCEHLHMLQAAFITGNSLGFWPYVCFAHFACLTCAL